MKFSTQKLLALAALTSLAACSGGGASNTQNPLPIPSPVSVTSRIVGVGDSLTAGFQSNGFLGQIQPAVPNPNAGAPIPIVVPGQESGFWSLLYQRATGLPWVAMASPATSVLPLIAGPGLGNQLVNAGPTSPLPFAPSKQSACQTEDQAAYSATAYASTRISPLNSPLDVAVPGMTLHETIAMVRPLSPTCAPIPGIPASVAGLLSIVNGESEMFYPVLGQFQNLGQNLTQLNAAVSLHPSLTTVWLGANDLLKYTFSGGQFCAGDSTHLVNGVCTLDTNGSQVQADMTKIITSLQSVGSKVVVANIPDILLTPQFARTSAPPAPAACQVQTYAVCVYAAVLTPIYAAHGDPNAVADGQAAANAIVTYVNATYNLGANGFLTETGATTALQEAVNAQTGAVTVTNINLDPNGPGTGLGQMYLTTSFATAVQSYNDTINSAIGAAATANSVPLVDIKTIFEGIASGNLANPYFQAAAGVNPGKCCTLTFGGGLLSFDGLHPSNTGYALVAQAFIAVIDQAFNAGITPMTEADVQAIYNGTGPNNPPAIPDPYAPH